MDGPDQHIKREVQAALYALPPSVTGARIEAYTDATHTASVTLQPDSRAYPNVPVLPPYGLQAGYKEGASCVVLLDRGVPVLIVAPLPSDQDSTPDTLLFHGDVSVLGALTVAGPLGPAVVRVLPQASAAFANQWLTLASDTAASQPYFCQVSADGTLFSWHAITLAP